MKSVVALHPFNASLLHGGVMGKWTVIMVVMSRTVDNLLAMY